MKSIDIDNIKKFTTCLFAGTDFDGFLVPEAQFYTSCTFSIDGHLNSGFFDDQDLMLPENAEGIAFWKRIRPVCYEIIKGKKVPSRFTIILMASSVQTAGFLKKSGISDNPGEINGLYINVHFRQGKLSCTTGCSLKTFSLDRKVETAWDEYVTEYIRQYQ